MRCAAAVLPIGVLVAMSAQAQRQPRPAAPPEVRRVEVKAEPKLERTIAAWLGTPYRRGGTRKSGADCSGFVRAVAREQYALDLPHSSRKQYRLGTRVKRAELRRGDLVFFATGQKDRVNHVGIYMGRGKFVHASESRGVVYDRLADYKGQYRGARRIPQLR